MWYIVSFLLGCLITSKASKATKDDLEKTALYLAFIQSSKQEIAKVVVKEIQRLYMEGKLEEVLYNGFTYKFTPSEEMINAFHKRLQSGNIDELLR